MTARKFPTPLQAQLFRAVRFGLKRLGYRGQLLAEDYYFSDWFAENAPGRSAALAAFGQWPPSYETACFGVFIPDDRSGANLVQESRALGAPIALEVKPDRVVQWSVGRGLDSTREIATFSLDDIARVFTEHKQDWQPASFLRAKNIPFERSPEQLLLFDDDLVPELEERIQERLDPIMAKACAKATRTYRSTAGKAPNPRHLFRVAFWVLAAKIFHDRGMPHFVELSQDADADAAITLVAKHYRYQPSPLLLNRASRTAIFKNIWTSVDFRNLSTDVLTSIWAKTFVTPQMRRQLGIHPTRKSIAQYIVNRLPFKAIPRAERIVIEPCCGSGVFLVAAMQRLRELLPRKLSDQDRHKYLKKRLIGFEKEAFGVEISRLALMLADFPNANGWHLYERDVFHANDFAQKLSHARVVLCNPPFETIPVEDRALLKSTFVQKPAEVLRTVLSNLHRDGVLGFVVPRTALDGDSYATIRESLARRFANIEIVELPDIAFETAQHPSALLIAQSPRDDGDECHVLHREVFKAGWADFVRQFSLGREDETTKTVAEAKQSLIVPRLSSVWKYVADYQRLGEIAEVHRGIEWNINLRARDPKTNKWVETGNRELLVRSTRHDGYKPGVAPQAKPFYSFELPATQQMCVQEKYEKGLSFHRPWEDPKVIVNAKRKGRHPWRLAAAPDTSGLVFYQTFTGVWPTNPRLAGVLAAVLNGPLANAFVATRELRDNINDTLEAIPIPPFSKDAIGKVDALIAEYVALRSATFMLADRDSKAVDLLMRIDAAILQSYRLPPRLEKELLDFFSGHPRQVPFPFPDYFPAKFKPAFTLAEWLTRRPAEATAARFRSISRDVDPDILRALTHTEEEL